jgi:hypothetical protein
VDKALEMLSLIPYEAPQLATTQLVVKPVEPTNSCDGCNSCRSCYSCEV